MIYVDPSGMGKADLSFKGFGGASNSSSLAVHPYVFQNSLVPGDPLRGTPLHLDYLRSQGHTNIKVLHGVG